MRTPAHSRQTRVRRSYLHTALCAAVSVHAAGAAIAAVAAYPGLAATLCAFVLGIVAILFGIATVMATHRAECPACRASLVVPAHTSSEAVCERCAAPVVSHAGRVFVAAQAWTGEQRREWSLVSAARD